MTTSTTQVAPLDELERLRAATLGEYEILGELGRGGMATVYLAHEIALDRKVAIKLISGHLGAAPDLVERFRRESRTAASLSHPNIIPIYAVRDADGLLFFAMKLVEGRPLDAVVREAGALPVPMVQAIFAQVGSAVGYAHRRGVVHRDIKPGNILVDEEGWCVVTDFGIAKVAESEGLTTSGVMVGTPTYMSPEQCLAHEVGPASDQYSLGVVLYELLTGKLPFPGTAMMSVMYAHVHTPPPPITELRPDCPADVADAVMRMLAKEPAERWPSLEAAVAAIGTVSQSQDETTRSQLITLARSGEKPLSVRYNTPRSPIPLGRLATPAPTVRTPMAAATATPAPVAPLRSQAPLVAGVLGAAALISAALYFSPGRRAAATAEAAPPVAAAAEPTTPPPSEVALPSVQQSPVSPATAPAAGARPAPPTGTKEKVAAPARREPRAEPAAAAASQPAVSASASVRMEEPEVVEAPKELSGGAALLNTPRGPATIAPTTRDAIERAVAAYARALADGDAAAAESAWPAMPQLRRQQLDRDFADGLRYSTRWTVSDLKVDGSRATARLRGNTTDVRSGSVAGSRAVDEEIALVRRGSAWKLQQIAQ